MKYFLVSLLFFCSVYASLAWNDHRIKKRFNWRQETNVYWSENCDWKDNDLSNVQIPSQQCGSRCAQTSGCTHFTWTNHNGGTCWMKKNAVSLDKAQYRQEYSVCGMMKSSSTSSQFNWREEGNLYWAENCDWNNNDLSNVKIPGKQCGSKCTQTSGCTHFVWTSYNGGTCWMKKNAVNRDQAKTIQEYSICGIMKSGSNPPPLPPSPSESGKTTRYWDCCKVSCGWNSKADVSAPFGSCEKNGNSRIDVNAQSGCGGGPSFACNSNQPWAISDTLSYGFAAAALTGKTERDWCCACYELTFTSGPVTGKKFVVQVSNTGGDLGHNHFDLQIPGGGVGIFNGCQAQWGAPGDGWGARYGGVSNRNDCNQLPAELRPGCFWRFDWFQNADNPTMNFRRVKCPVELTQKSGCRRNDDN